MTSAVGGDATCGDGDVDGDGVPTMTCVARVSALSSLKCGNVSVVTDVPGSCGCLSSLACMACDAMKSV